MSNLCVSLGPFLIWNPSPSLIYIFSLNLISEIYWCSPNDHWFKHDGECLRRPFPENHLGTAGYHHAADFIEDFIDIIILGGAGNTAFCAAGYTLFTLATRLHAQLYYQSKIHKIIGIS